jgi:hypothetical protein
MSPQELLLQVFCLVDDELQALNVGRLRARGPCPKLADSEVIPMELVGEFWKLHTDQDLFRHFRRYHLAEFPALAQVDRTTFARLAANLWHVKQYWGCRWALSALAIATTGRPSGSTAWPPAVSCCWRLTASSVVIPTRSVQRG